MAAFQPAWSLVRPNGRFAKGDICCAERKPVRSIRQDAARVLCCQRIGAVTVRSLGALEEAERHQREQSDEAGSRQNRGGTLVDGGNHDGDDRSQNDRRRHQMPRSIAVMQALDADRRDNPQPQKHREKADGRHVVDRHGGEGLVKESESERRSQHQRVSRNNDDPKRPAGHPALRREQQTADLVKVGSG